MDRYSTLHAVRRLFWLGVGCFLLNDFWLMILPPGPLFYLADYLFRFLLLGMVAWMAVRCRLTKEQLLDLFFLRGPTISFKRLASWTVLATVAGVAIDQTVWPFLAARLPLGAATAYPPLTGWLKGFDLSVGIAMVAVTEEIWFRGMARQVFAARLIPWQLVAVTSLLFGLAHWSLGAHAVISAGLWAVLPMIALIRTGSLWPALIAHYMTDVVAFSGIIPPAWYRLF